MLFGKCSYNWLISVPPPFLKNISDLRRKERRLLEKSGIIQSLTTASLFIAPTVATTVMFLIHTCLQLKLTVSLVSAWNALSPSPLPHIDRELSLCVFS